MLWIEYRDLTAGETVRYETDDLQMATVLLRAVAAQAPENTELIDFSGDLDGVLDFDLAGVKLFPAPETAKAA